MKNSTAIGKLFRTTIIASLLSPLAVSAQASYGDSVSGPFNPGTNYVETLVNFFHWHGGLLDKEDKRIYQQSLMIMLENMPVGQVMDWYSQTNPDVSGKMRVVYGYQTTNGYCRVYQSLINKNGNSKQVQEYACRSMDNPRWEFYNK